MTDGDFERRLRAGIRQLVDEAAPGALRAAVLAIPDVGAPRRVATGWRSPPMNRFASVALAAVIAVIVIGIGLGLFGRLPNVGPQPPAPTASGGAISPEPSSSDRIGAIAYVTESGLSPLFLLLSNEEPRQLAPSDTVGNDVVCPSFSPDGTKLAVGMPGGSIVVMSIDDQGHTGDATRLNGPAGETPHCAAWAPDSSAVAFLDGSALVIVPLAAEPQRVEGWDTGAAGPFARDYPADRAVQWSPDGSVIAVARPSGTWLIPTDGGAPRRLHETAVFSVSWSPDGTRLVLGAGGPQAIVIGVADGTTLAQLPTGFGPPVWSPVEDWIAFSDAEAGLVVVRPDGSQPIVIDDYGYHPTWSPDGRQLIYLQDAASAAWRLMLADAAGSGEPAMIVDSVAIYSARSFPAAEQFTWQPVNP